MTYVSESECAHATHYTTAPQRPTICLRLACEWKSCYRSTVKNAELIAKATCLLALVAALLCYANILLRRFPLMFMLNTLKFWTVNHEYRHRKDIYLALPPLAIRRRPNSIHKSMLFKFDEPNASKANGIKVGMSYLQRIEHVCLIIQVTRYCWLRCCWACLHNLLSILSFSSPKQADFIATNSADQPWCHW